MTIGSYVDEAPGVRLVPYVLPPRQRAAQPPPVEVSIEVPIELPVASPPYRHAIARREAQYAAEQPVVQQYKKGPLSAYTRATEQFANLEIRRE